MWARLNAQGSLPFESFLPTNATCPVPVSWAAPCLRGSLRVFNDVNEQAAAGKTVFLKALSPVHAFKEQLPDVPLLREPVVTLGRHK